MKQAHGGEFVNFIGRPHISVNISVYAYSLN